MRAAPEVFSVSLLPSASMAGLDTIVDEGEEGLEGPGQATKQGGPGGDVSVDVDGVQAYATVLPSHTPAPPFSSSPVGLAWAGGPAGGNELGGGGKPFQVANTREEGTQAQQGYQPYGSAARLKLSALYTPPLLPSSPPTPPTPPIALAHLWLLLVRLWTALRNVAQKVGTYFWDGPDDDMQAGSYETQILEDSIDKISRLLAVGFGDAGGSGGEGGGGKGAQV